MRMCSDPREKLKLNRVSRTKKRAKYLLAAVLLLESVVCRFAVPYDAGRHFLWEARSSGTTVYLLGSMHMATPDMYPLPDVIENAFTSSDVLVVEANINDLSIMDSGLSLVEKMTFTDNRTLKSTLSGKTYALAKDKLEAVSMPIGMMEKYKPWYIAMTLEMLHLQALGLNPLYGIDLYFLSKAQAANKEIRELESIEYQIALFDGFTSREQDVFLYHKLKQLDSLGSDIDQIKTCWLTGDTARLSAMFDAVMKSDHTLASVYNKLLFKRNAEMARKIRGFFSPKAGRSRKTYFVVVGAGHLVGKNGIVSILERKGVTVTQL